MNGNKLTNDRPNHYDVLLKEIMNGLWIRDVLPTPAYDFAEERQARYYSNMRWNMESDVAERIMKNYQQNAELNYLKKGWMDG